MPKGITVTEAATRLTEAGSRLSDRYARGASGKGASWQRGASAAEGNYKAGVTAAAAAGKFGKGVQAAGGASYDQGVSTKGVANWPTGMQFAGDKYQRKVAKVAALWNQPLATPRGPRGSPANRNRITENITRFEAAAK